MLSCRTPPTNSLAVPAQLPGRTKLFILAASIYLVTINFWTWGIAAPLALAGRGDFRQFYAAGAMVRAHKFHEIYDYATQKDFQDRLVSLAQAALPFVSPAYHALLFAPLSLLPYRTAYFVWFGCNLAVLALCFMLLRPWMQNLRAIYSWLPLVLLMGFEPLAAAVVQGQDSILLTGLLSCALMLLSRNRNFYAGLLVGLGFFKLSIVLPIALLFLIWRRWRFSIGFAASVILLTAVSVGLSGIAQTKLYIASLVAIAGLRPPVSNLSRYPITLPQMANVHGFLFGIGSGWMPKLWLHAMTVLLSFVVLAWTARKARHMNGPSMLLVAIPCSVLVSHHTYIHDLSVLLIPIVVLLGSFSQFEGNAESRRGSTTLAATLMLVAPVAESFSPNHFFVVALVVLFFLKTLSDTVQGTEV